MADFKTEYEEHLSTWGPNCGASLKTYKGHLDRLMAPLHEEIARLRKDKDRLDWLESSGFSTTQGMGDRPVGVYCWHDRSGRGWTSRYISAEFTNARDAIDAAMRAE